MIWRLILLFLAYIPLGGHFLRMGSTALAIVIALLPLLALLRIRAVIHFLQLGLVIGVIAVWMPTTVEIAQVRIAMGAAWMRMAVILSVVMLFSLATAWCAHGIYSKDKV